MPTSKRFKLILALVALVTLVFVRVEYVNNQSYERQLHTNYRVPVNSPPVDPNRPDLFEEPTIDE